MAQSAEDWAQYFAAAGIPNAQSTTYAKLFVDNRIGDPSDLTKDLLKEIGVTIVGDIIAIMNKSNDSKTGAGTSQLATHDTAPSPAAKPQSVNAPQLRSDMTHPEYRKFRVDWTVYKTLTKTPRDQVAAIIYNACDSAVQNSIINTCDNFFTLNEDAILTTIEKIVTQQSNPSVHRLAFSNISQSETESIKDFLVRLKSTAKDCEFQCPNCQHDLLPLNVKDQFIRGLSNSMLQTDILAKAETLNTLELAVKHAEAFESALHNQSRLQDTSQRLWQHEHQTTNVNSKTRVSTLIHNPRASHQHRIANPRANNHSRTANSRVNNHPRAANPRANSHIKIADPQDLAEVVVQAITDQHPARPPAQHGENHVAIAER